MNLEELLQQVPEVGEGWEETDMKFCFFLSIQLFYLSTGNYRLICKDYHTQIVRFLLEARGNEAL